MKILKILLILLVPALGIVSCQKSDTKPGCGNTSQHESTTNKTTEVSNGASDRVVESTEEDKGSTIVGSGDDDRDGGDKRHKK